MLIEIYATIKDFAYFPDRALDSFRSLYHEAGSTFEIIKLLETEYQKAAVEIENPRIIYKKQSSLIVDDPSLADRIYLISNLQSVSDNSAIVLSFIPNKKKDKQPWEMERAITESEYSSSLYAELGNKPKDMLFNFCYWPNYLEDLKELKNNLALPENWSYSGSPADEDFPILKSYITYTFAKLWIDKQVYQSLDQRYSVMNTGLVNRNYQYIYILFERNNGTKPWKFCMLCIPGVKYGGRLLANEFRSLPGPARYFKDISDISYMIAADKSPDEQLPDLQPDHYFVDHPDRLPLHFLLDGCRKSPELIELLKDSANKLTQVEIMSHWKLIGELISSNPDVYDDLESSFRNSVRKAVMRVSWNYRTAIPVYFPSFHKMSILLPLSFSSEKEAEVALVVERNAASQKYTAPTILPLPTAYANARLVCKPESDWLNQRVFEQTACESQIEDVED